MLKPACACATSALRSTRFVGSAVAAYQPVLGPQSVMNNHAFLVPQRTPLEQRKNFLFSKSSESHKALIEMKPENVLPESKSLTRDEKIQLFFHKVFTKMFPFKKHYNRAKLMDAASYLYEEIADQIDVQEFFHEFNMPDTFASWFTVVELHVYLLSARIMNEDKIGMHVRDMVTDSFWDDVVYRSHKLGPRASVHRKKQLMILACQFQAAFYGYDEGIQSNDMVLAAALWRRFFGFECSDSRQIERLVKYMRIHLVHLKAISFEDLLYNRPQLVIPLSEITV